TIGGVEYQKYPSGYSGLATGGGLMTVLVRGDVGAVQAKEAASAALYGAQAKEGSGKTTTMMLVRELTP
ncbi:MAG: hypothetical protein MJ006_05695, partial [Methanocorpusculum sp.]|nr:hypothetical protein [Methanocorpusculum sp.]